MIIYELWFFDNPLAEMKLFIFLLITSAAILASAEAVVEHFESTSSPVEKKQEKRGIYSTYSSGLGYDGSGYVGGLGYGGYNGGLGNAGYSGGLGNAGYSGGLGNAGYGGGLGYAGNSGGLGYGGNYGGNLGGYNSLGYGGYNSLGYGGYNPYSRATGWAGGSGGYSGYGGYYPYSKSLGYPYNNGYRYNSYPSFSGYYY